MGRKNRESDALVYYANERSTKFWTKILSLSLLPLFWHSLPLSPPLRVDSLLLFFILSLRLFSTPRFRRPAPGSRRKQVVSATPATYGACGLLQICRSLAKIQERCRKRRRRRRTRGRKESSRIRVTCDSLCTWIYTTSRLRRSPARPVLSHTLLAFSFFLSVSSLYTGISDCKSLTPSPCHCPYVASAKRDNETAVSVAKVDKTLRRNDFLSLNLFIRNRDETDRLITSG